MRGVEPQLQRAVGSGLEGDVCANIPCVFGQGDVQSGGVAAADAKAVPRNVERVEPARRGENAHAAAVVADDERFARVVWCGELQVETYAVGVGRVGVVQYAENLSDVECDMLGVFRGGAAEGREQGVAFFRARLGDRFRARPDPAFDSGGLPAT